MPQGQNPRPMPLLPAASGSDDPPVEMPGGVAENRQRDRKPEEERNEADCKKRRDDEPPRIIVPGF